MGRRFDKHECSNLEYSLKQEWLETNGLGGFACGTILGCNTRKYHSVLTVPTSFGRFNLLSKVDDYLKIGDQECYLNLSKYLGAPLSEGLRYLENVDIGIFPCFTFKVHGRLIQKSIQLLYKQNTALIRYELLEGDDTLLHLRPLLSYKELHALSKENSFLQVRTFVNKDLQTYKLSCYQGLPSIYFKLTPSCEYYPGPDWYKNFEYEVEKERGYDYVEDLFCPGIFEVELKKGRPVIFSASTKEIETSDLGSLFDKEAKRRKEEFDRCKGISNDESEAILRYTASEFLIENYRGEKSVIAGYPWFEEWGRDTFIAILGLAIYNDKADVGFDIIKSYTRYEKDGLIPNYLCGSNVSYNSIDAALLWFRAVQEYGKKTGNYKKIITELLPVMKKMIDAYFDGKVPYVELKDNGMLWAGNSETQLTWMDAMAWGHPVTSRHGFAVEINALWYNMLCFYLELLDKAGMKAESRIVKTKDLCQANFTKEFWNYERSCLYDVVNEQGKDRSVRPNQLYVVALDYSLLTREQGRSVVKVVEDCLITPYGLRTLDPADPKYAPYYRGNQDERDSQYHQGTVWPWLIGLYVEASMKVTENKDDTVKKIRKTFFPLFEKHLVEYGVWNISEIMDAEYPYLPNGCFAQAWSTGELIRSLDFLKR